jgi:cytochrome c
MDSFEFNKIAGAVLGALLVILGGNKLLSLVYAPTIPDKKSYVVEGVVAEGAPAAAPAAAEPEKPFALLIQAADAEKGKKVTAQCLACHSFVKGGPNMVGPNLYGIIGSPYAHKDDFSYSDAFKAEHAKGRVWSMEDLFTYLKDPKTWVPGNKMSFAGLKKPEQRADVIAYLRTMNDNPPPLPKPPAAEAPAPAAPAPAGAPK